MCIRYVANLGRKVRIEIVYSYTDFYVLYTYMLFKCVTIVCFSLKIMV